MRAKRVEQSALAMFFVAACVMFFMATYAAIAHAQNPSTSTVPQQSEVPVSPATPGTLPGTEARPGTAVDTNPITGRPCVGGGASALNGGLPGAATASGQPSVPGQDTSGLPPNSSIYGLGTTTNPGAC